MSQIGRTRALMVALALLGAFPVTGRAAAQPGLYRNPVPIAITTGGQVENCPDPTVVRQHGEGVQPWFAYCTTDPRNDQDRSPSGFNFHLMAILRSFDLVNWTYLGDVFQSRPAWVAPTAGLWAPDVEYVDGRYLLYFAAQDTVAGGSAIGVATAPSPAGPWSDSGAPVVAPEAAACCPGSRRALLDPDFLRAANGHDYLYFGSYFGGVSVRLLNPGDLTSDPSTETQVAIPNRYEGAEVVPHGGYYYLFGSATNCCNGPLTGYAVFAGRSSSPTGPFMDQNGVSLLAGRVGGSPVIEQNGNRFVGPGHNEVFTDFDGQTWTLYHAVDVNQPYFAGAPGFTKRHLMLDAVDWLDGWPVLNGGQGPSDAPRSAPAAQPGQVSSHRVKKVAADQPGSLIETLSNEFSRSALNPQWS